MNALLRFAHRIDRISEAMGKVAIYLTLLLIAVGFYNVAARYTGRFIGQNLSSNRWIETQWYVYSVIFFLMFAYNLRHNVNVRVDFLYANWGVRRKAWIDLLGTIFFLIPFCIMGIWATITPVLFSWRLWEMSPDPGGLPRAPIKTFIIVAFTLLLMQAIAQAIKYAAVLTGHREVQREIEQDATPVDLS
ncbi:MAG: TRAP transporter small permease subunit [Caldilinea sp.]|nr:TRAP transporter small permease subunit [Caldilinea sp.]MDW8441071.1 TRAP transporter small permease subunit [Caldilineaceae bacterium]